MNNKETLLALLAQQVRYATGLDGKSGMDAKRERQIACAAANSTLEILEKQFGLDPEEVLVEAMEAAVS